MTVSPRSRNPEKVGRVLKGFADNYNNGIGEIIGALASDAELVRPLIQYALGVLSMVA